MRVNPLSIKNKSFITIFHDLEPENGEVGGKIYEKIIYKMLDIQDRFALKTTYNIVGEICDKCPDIIMQIYKRGHELANHTYSHELPSLVPKEKLEKSILECENIIQELTGVKLKGFRSPQSKWNKNLLKILKKRGYEWNAEADSNKQPYYIGKNLIRLSITMDDWGYQSEGLSEKSMYKRLKGRLEQGIKNKQYMAFGFHPWIYGLKKERLKVFEDFISFLSSQDRIFVVPFREATKLFKERYKNYA